MGLIRIFLMASLFSTMVFAGTTGNVRGVVTETDKKEPMGGVTVVATSTVMQGEVAALTDEAGFYTISNLPPGTYTITAMFAGVVSERTGVVVSVDRTVNINMGISMSAAAGEVYTINEKAPNIDVASSTIGVTVTKEYIENVPMGRDRNFDNAMKVLPTSGGDAYGTAVGGATSPENTYVIDGLNTTDPSTGLLGTRLVLEFIDQFDIKEGGYGPEFGRATGGFVNAVTKSGSNEFHGSVFTYWRPRFLQVIPKIVQRATESLVSRNRLYNYLNFGFEFGGPIIKDKLWFHVGYSPEIQSDEWIREVRPVIDIIDKNLVMSDEPAFRDSYNSLAQSHQYTLKLTHAINNNNRHSLGIRGSPTLFSGAVTNPFDNDSPSRGMRGGPETFQFQQTSGNFVSGVYNFAGKYFNDKFKVDAYLGTHYQKNIYNPLGEASNLDKARIGAVYQGSSYLGLDKVWEKFAPESGPVPAECNGEFSPGIPKCPTQNYSRNGFGNWADFSLFRFAEKVMFTNLFEIAGLHQFKYGIDLEQLQAHRRHGYTGEGDYRGAFQDFVDEGYFKGNLYTVTGKVVDQIQSTAQTLNWGAFVGDSWNPTPNLVLNYGLRWEGQNFFGVKSPAEWDQLAYKFSVLDNWAPRAGLVWDIMGNGKSAIRMNYGRFYESIPLDINERAFGGEGSKIGFWDRTKCKNENGNELKPINVTNPAKQCEQFNDGKDDQSLGGEDSIVAPGIKGQYSDEFVLSADIEPVPSWVFGVAGVYRYMGRVIEDMSVDGGNTYVFANPGDYDINSMYQLRQQMLHEKDPAKSAQLGKLISLLPRVNEFPKPVRDLWQLQFRVDKKVSEHFMMLATYVVSWAWGNYPGLFSANNGQLDPNLTSQFDLPQLLINRMGYLPQDRRHRMKVSGFYKASLKDYGVNVPLFFNIGLSGYVQSGSPYEVLGSDMVYGADEIFILPRGAGGRTPWTWGADLNVGIGYHITEGVTAEIFAALYNITNNQAPVAYDDSYTYDNVRPIEGGTFDQLKYARNLKGNPIKVNPNYGNAIAYQQPFGAQLGFRLKF